MYMYSPVLLLLYISGERCFVEGFQPHQLKVSFWLWSRLWDKDADYFSFSLFEQQYQGREGAEFQQLVVYI